MGGRLSIATFSSVLALCGCSENKKTILNQYSASAVATVSELPTCDQERQGQLYFVESDQQFRVCKESVWTAITINQDDDDEENVTKIAASIHCSGQLEGTELRFDYSAAILTSGDVFAHGAVMNNLIEIGGTSFYAKDQLGAASAGVLFEFDVSGLPDAGFWSITLDRSTLVTVIDYMDYDLAGVRRTWTMTPEACVLNSYSSP